MLRKSIISDENQNGAYVIYEIPDFEFVNPIIQIGSTEINASISILKDLLRTKQLDIPQEYIETYIEKTAIAEWIEKLKQLEQLKIPENLLALLEAKRKKEQLKLLKNLSITSEILMAFIFKAFKEFGFLFSQYKSELLPKGTDRSELPIAFEAKDDKVLKIGTTSVTDGKLKQLVEQRKVIIAKFIDKGEEWHCFFYTYNSLSGKEAWGDGKPHCHYISNKFGLPRKTVVQSLKEGRYNLGTLPHIEFERS